MRVGRERAAGVAHSGVDAELTPTATDVHLLLSQLSQGSSPSAAVDFSSIMQADMRWIDVAASGGSVDLALNKLERESPSMATAVRELLDASEDAAPRADAPSSAGPPATDAKASVAPSASRPGDRLRWFLLGVCVAVAAAAILFLTLGR
jgi:hypothetical protein